jgi:hypothetical protein
MRERQGCSSSARPVEVGAEVSEAAHAAAASDKARQMAAGADRVPARAGELAPGVGGAGKGRQDPDKNMHQL